MRIFAKIDGTTGAMTPGAKTILSKSFTSDPAVLEDFYVWLEGALAPFPLERKDSDRVVMATAEAFSNAVQHGNRANLKKEVRVELVSSGERLTLRVGDEGPGSPPFSSKKSRLFDTSGRGWELMHQLSDGVSIRRENGFFWVELSFKMPKTYKGKLKKKKGKKSD